MSDTQTTDLPQSADTLEDARALALHYQSVAASQGTACLRYRLALMILREFSGLGEGYHAGVTLTIKAWIDAGMDQPIPWPQSVFFDSWARTKGLSNVDGCVGYRMTMKMPVRSQ